MIEDATNASGKIKISIITSVLNAGETIKRTIQSVANQTYQDTEYLIIDGLSADNTLDIIRSSRDKIDFWLSESDQGLYSGMNKGALNAKGDYLYFLNADDWLYDEKVIEWAISVLSKKKPDILFANTCLIYPGYQVDISRKFSNLNLKRGLIPPHQGSFIKKSLFDDIGGFDEKLKYAADLDLLCRLKRDSYYYLEEDRPIAFVSSGGISSHKDISYPEVVSIIEKYYGKLPAGIYWGKKVLLEQGIKKLLINLRLTTFYQILSKLKNMSE